MTGAPIGALVLDLDGTLHDHDSAASAGFAAWLRGHGAAPTAELEQEWFRIEREWFARWERGEIDFLGRRIGRIREFLPLLGRERPVGDAEGAAEFERYLAAYRREWRPYPEVPEFLDRVAALGMPTAVLSNGESFTQRAKLDAIGVGHRLGPLITADIAGAPKPDPRAYAAACAAVDRPPAAVLHVGDRYDLDVAAPRRFGMRALHLDRRGTSPDADAAGSLLAVVARLRDSRPGHGVGAIA